MEHFIEGILELLFNRISKESPEKIPEIQYRENYIIKSSRRKIVLNTVASLLLIALFVGFWLIFNVDKDTKILFLIFILLGLIILSFTLSVASYKCTVTPEKLTLRLLFFIKKSIVWKDIICLRIIEMSDEKNVIIALYNKEKKCVYDVATGMQNVWYLVKMAEYKGIEIRKEKDLTIKQIRCL